MGTKYKVYGRLRRELYNPIFIQRKTEYGIVVNAYSCSVCKVAEENSDKPNNVEVHLETNENNVSVRNENKLN